MSQSNRNLIDYRPKKLVIVSMNLIIFQWNTRIYRRTMDPMDYLRHWREHTAAARALADSSDEDHDQPRATIEQINESSSHHRSEYISDSSLPEDSYEEDYDSSNFEFSETVVTSSSSEEISDNNEGEEENSLKEQLATWATSNNLSRKCVDELLNITL